jgi:membrane protein
MPRYQLINDGDDIFGEVQLGELPAPHGGGDEDAAQVATRERQSGIFVEAVGAAGVFGQLKDALNMVWHVEMSSKSGIVGMLRERFLSFSMVLVIGFLLLVSLVISTLLSALNKYFNSLFSLPPIVFSVANFFVSLLIIGILLAVMYKVLSEVRLAWKYVLPASIITAVFFTIGKELISLYISHASVSSSYGAAGSLIIILLWVFYTGQIFFYGAELIKSEYLMKKIAIEPKEKAVMINTNLSGENHRKTQQSIPKNFLAGIMDGFFKSNKKTKFDK